jgi:hypothetical protein
MTKKSQPEKGTSRAPEAGRELRDDELDAVAGGVAAGDAGATTTTTDTTTDGTPRDVQSGLPTGKRMHKPYTVTGG